MSPPRLILASASPRRVELLRAAGFAFDVDPADIDEDDVPPDLLPRDVAMLLALNKASRVAARHRGAVVLGADTIVECYGERLGKADSPDAARAMIRKQAGRSQDVLTGLAVVAGETVTVDVVASQGVMRPMTDAEIDAYVAGDDWRGKAGAYGIQDVRDDPFVRLLHGPFDNVVGLPIERVAELLASVGVRPGAAR